MPKRKATNRTKQEVAAQVKPGTPGAIVDLIAKQLERAKEAASRIETEGSVVRDMKGSVIAHPAIRIELDATRLAAELLARHKGRR